MPFPGSEDFVVGYAGVDDKLNGRVAAELVDEARDYMLDQGATLSSDGGNAIIIGFVAGYQAGIDRSAEAISILEDAGISVLGSVDVGFNPAEGYDGTKELVAAHRDSGIDLVYAHNSALAEGVIQALEEEGFTPGSDVMVVGGTCHGNLRARGRQGVRAFGALQGLLIHRLRIHSLVFTLGSLIALRGLAFIISNENSVVLQDLDIAKAVRRQLFIFSPFSLVDDRRVRSRGRLPRLREIRAGDPRHRRWSGRGPGRWCALAPAHRRRVRALGRHGFAGRSPHLAEVGECRAGRVREPLAAIGDCGVDRRRLPVRGNGTAFGVAI
ncbi:MAG: substrate-binding domain-containing protein, partial [Acidimicrobiia bacterium]|nr:substrate-binding domain-containing protein [Acidimicrobiia bacterium]